MYTVLNWDKYLFANWSIYCSTCTLLFFYNCREIPIIFYLQALCFFYCFTFSLFFPPFSLYHSIYFILFLSPSSEDSEARRNVLVHKLKEAQTTLELQTERLSKIENSARENNSLVEGLKFKEQVSSLRIFQGVFLQYFFFLRFRKLNVFLRFTYFFTIIFPCYAWLQATAAPWERHEYAMIVKNMSGCSLKLTIKGEYDCEKVCRI